MITQQAYKLKKIRYIHIQISLDTINVVCVWLITSINKSQITWTDHTLQNIFQAIVLAKLCYASSAWWGYTNTCDRKRIEAFLKRSVRSRFSASSLTFTDLCQTVDARLFNNIVNNNSHISQSVAIRTMRSLFLACPAKQFQTARQDNFERKQFHH